VGGHNSYKTVGDKWMYHASAQSYEPGHPNMFGLTVLEAAILRKNEMGVANIDRNNRQLAELFLSKLTDVPVKLLGDHTMTNRSAIIYLEDEDGLGDLVRQNNIIVTQRNGFLRVSMHYYNTEADVMALVNCIQSKFVSRLQSVGS
jgi:selenocysteine lyase/cysteine desulfurase